jgi:hypothetical protein
VSLKKHVCVPNFLTKPAPHLFLGTNGPFGAFGGKTILHQNFSPFCLSSPQNRFSEKHVSGQNFFPKPHHNNYRERTDYVALLGQNLSGAKFRSLKKHACVPNFLTKLPPHVFLGQNGPFGAFWGKTISHQNIASFCLLRPQNRFSEKHVSG